MARGHEHRVSAARGNLSRVCAHRRAGRRGRMSLPLLRKEAREHGPVLAATAAIAVLGLFAMLGVAEDVGGRFVGLARFQLLLGPLIALVFANRLLVREYSGRTQFFLETLPIGRARVFATKWLLGCALVL